MARGIVDYAGLKSAASQALRELAPEAGRPFNLTKIGHVVLMSTDLRRSVAFYTGVLGFRVSDVYPETMMKGRMVFMRCAADHHGVALVGQAPRAASGAPATSPQHELHHMAFEVATLETLEPSECISGQILRGLRKPHDCPAFGTRCTPGRPLGATMVSAEGACAAYYAYGRHHREAVTAP